VSGTTFAGVTNGTDVVGDNLIWIIIGAVACCFCCLIILLVVFMQRRRQKKRAELAAVTANVYQPHYTTPQYEQQQQQQQQQQQLMPVATYGVSPAPPVINGPTDYLMLPMVTHEAVAPAMFPPQPMRSPTLPPPVMLPPPPAAVPQVGFYGATNLMNDRTSLNSATTYHELNTGGSLHGAGLSHYGARPARLTADREQYQMRPTPTVETYAPLDADADALYGALQITNGQADYVATDLANRFSAQARALPPPPPM
jgi:hypothetical protein